MNILIPATTTDGVNALVSEHFGRCPYFALYNTTTKQFKFLKSMINHKNSAQTPIQQIQQLQPNVIITRGIGPKAISLAKNEGIQVHIVQFTTLKEVIAHLTEILQKTT